MGSWVSVTEQLPEANELVVTIRVGGGISTTIYKRVTNAGKALFNGDGRAYTDVTHWLRIPARPSTYANIPYPVKKWAEAA